MALLGKLCTAAVNISPCTGIPKEWKHFCIFLKYSAAASAAFKSLAGLLSAVPGQAPWELGLALCMALELHVSFKTPEKSLPAILTSILFDGLQKASSFDGALFSIMGKFGTSASDTKIMMLPSYLTQQGTYKGEKKKERFSTKSLPHCSKDSLPKCRSGTQQSFEETAFSSEDRVKAQKWKFRFLVWVKE